MFAGARLDFGAPLRVGEALIRSSVVTAVRSKRGRSGDLVFVTVAHVVTSDAGGRVEEEQDIVYRAAGGASSTPPPQAEPVSDDAWPWRWDLPIDPTLLFRFSALTYNAHRIHYDREFVQEEGYADLVVHGPLQALMMGELFRRNDVSLVGRRYAYRLVSPMIGCQRMSVGAGEAGIGSTAETLSEQGAVTAVGRLEDPS